MGDDDKSEDSYRDYEGNTEDKADLDDLSGNQSDVTFKQQNGTGSEDEDDVSVVEVGCSDDLDGDKETTFGCPPELG